MDYEENENDSREDEEDPVVKEVPLFLSKRLAEQLYILQYPLRPHSKKNPLNVRKCYVKTENQEVKLETELNTTSANFLTHKAEELAAKADGPRGMRKEGEVFFESDLLDKVTYESKVVVNDPEKYAVGIYNGREFHITPVKGILKLKPTHQYLDRDIKKKRDNKQSVVDNEEPGPSTSSAQQVLVKFARNDADRWKKSGESADKKETEKKSDEQWVECDWHCEGSELSELEKAKLYTDDVKNAWITSTVTSEDDPIDYIRRLVPEDKEQEIIKPSLPSNVFSFNALRELPLVEQCKVILKDAKIIQFQQLSMLLAGCEGVTADQILKTLPQVAVLVRGNWIVKSEILFPNKTLSAISGVPAEIMCRARDYILILFTKNQYVERRKVSSVLKIPAEELKDIFLGISKLRYNKGWELTLPCDVDFITKHQDVVSKQTAMWEQRSVQLNELFKEPAANKERKRRKSKSVSEVSDTDSGTEKNKSPSVARRAKIAKKTDSNAKKEIVFNGKHS